MRKERRLRDDPDYLAMKHSLQTMNEDRLEEFKAMLRQKLDKEDYQPDYLDPQEVAKLLGLTPQTIRLWIRKGSLHAKRFGPRKWFIPIDEVRKFF